jgi:hypothetical protein
MCGRARPLAVEWHKHQGMIRFYRKHFRAAYPAGLFGLVVAGVWIRFALVAARQTVHRSVAALARIPAWHVREALLESEGLRKAEAVLTPRATASPTLPS